MKSPTASTATSLDPVEIRKAKLLAFVDANLSKDMRGVEIGAYDRPMLNKPNYDIMYADVLSTESLREHAAMNPRRFPEKVVPVDFVIAENTLAQAIEGRGMSYVFGSHVFEHIPNLLGFLRDMASSLGKGGVLLGAYPDRRYTFDIDRPRTTLGQLLDRDLRQLKRPDAATVFDHFHHFRQITAGRVWNLGADHGLPRTHSLGYAFAEMRKSTEDYVDVHCNLFTDDEFAALIGEMSQLGVPVKLRSLERTKRPGNEFLFCLEVTH